jgi:hypothetical protein
MAPKAKPADRPHVLITGKAGTPQIPRSGASVAVTKKLSGAAVTETYPRTRVRGKQKQAPQLIPAQDVLQVLQTDATTTAANSFAEAERRMAARIVEERQRQLAEIQRKREREQRKMQMRVRTRLDTAVAALANKKKDEARAAARRAEVQRENERIRRDPGRYARARVELRSAVRAASGS